MQMTRIIWHRVRGVNQPIVSSGFPESLSDRRAYGSVTASSIDSFAPEIRGRVVDVFTQALHSCTLRFVNVVFAVMGLLLVVMEKEHVLRTGLETESGLEDKRKGIEND